jgi:hypothetical protein
VHPPFPRQAIDAEHAVAIVARMRDRLREHLTPAGSCQRPSPLHDGDPRMTDAIYCATCGGRPGECLCRPSRETSVSGFLGRPPSSRPPDTRDDLTELVGPLVLVAGHRAHMRRDHDGAYVVCFEGGELEPFRARGTPGEVLALAKDYVQGRPLPGR